MTPSANLGTWVIKPLLEKFQCLYTREGKHTKVQYEVISINIQ